MTDFKEYSELFHAAYSKAGRDRNKDSSSTTGGNDPSGEAEYRKMYEAIYQANRQHWPQGSYYLQIVNTLKNKYGNISGRMGVHFSAEDRQNIKRCYDYMQQHRTEYNARMAEEDRKAKERDRNKSFGRYR